MTRVLLEVALDTASLQNLRDLPAVSVHVVPAYADRWEVPGDLLDCQVMLCKHPPGNLERMTQLKLMQIATVGFEHLRHYHLADKPLRVCNARGIFDTAIAEWCVAMMINLRRDQYGMFRNQLQAHYERHDRFQQEIRGLTIGLWGYGGIGRETARVAKALGMKVHVLTRSGVKRRVNTYLQPNTGDPEGVLPDRAFLDVDRATFLAGLDFLILSLPRTRQSDGMVGAVELRTLPKTAFVLNPARGPIIQEAALIQALREQWIAGAALDTHYAYPLPPQHPLWKLPNVLLSPHISGADKSQHYPARIGDLFLSNLLRFLKGQPLLNELTAEEFREAELEGGEAKF